MAGSAFEGLPIRSRCLEYETPKEHCSAHVRATLSTSVVDQKSDEGKTVPMYRAAAGVLTDKLAPRFCGKANVWAPAFRTCLVSGGLSQDISRCAQVPSSPPPPAPAPCPRLVCQGSQRRHWRRPCFPCTRAPAADALRAIPPHLGQGPTDSDLSTADFAATAAVCPKWAGASACVPALGWRKYGSGVVVVGGGGGGGGGGE